MTATEIRIATRGSQLARTQTDGIARQITTLTGLPCRLVLIRTEGDDTTGPLTGGSRPGLFTSAVRDALHRGEADIAVHSMKDLPSEPEPGLTIAAIPEREIPFDALVAAHTLTELPSGARLGTSSPRRAAALRRARPDLLVVGLRGNVDSRLSQVAAGQVDAAIVAAAGLARLGRLTAAIEVLDPEQMVPAPAQGALAVECPTASPFRSTLAALDDPATRLAVTAERAVLRGVGASCTTAVGAYASFDDTTLTLTAELSEHRGVDYAAASQSADIGASTAAATLGQAVALTLLAAPGSSAIDGGRP
ncbi:MAG: hydroxymethylbilane synthase [Propioniciclava sp.]